MKIYCPHCDQEEDTVVRDTIVTTLGIRRRRECLVCKNRFNTFERTVLSTPRVRKKTGKVEDFNHEKLAHSIRLACRKLKISSELLEKLATEIEVELTLGQQEIDSKIIGNIVLEKLKHIHPIAYLRYAAIYLNWQDLALFKDGLDNLIDEVKKLSQYSQNENFQD